MSEKIAVLGMGLLGVGFALHLLEEGHDVVVWNRTPAKCDPVREAGGTVAASPAAAIQGASRVHLILSEDDVVDKVLAAMGSDADRLPIIDHSTNAPDKVRARCERRANYVHAPVFMGPQNSRSATGLMLVSGDARRTEPLLPALRTMTGKVLELGSDPGRAAAVKLSGNAMLVVMAAGMGEVFALTAANGLSAEDALTLFDTFSPTCSGLGRRILDSADGKVGFELSMARKDVRLMIETAKTPLTVLPAIAGIMDEALEAGRGSEDFAAVLRP